MHQKFNNKPKNKINFCIARTFKKRKIRKLFTIYLSTNLDEAKRKNGSQKWKKTAKKIKKSSSAL